MDRLVCCSVRGPADPRVLGDLAVAAEAAGFDGVLLWITLNRHHRNVPVAERVCIGLHRGRDHRRSVLVRCHAASRVAGPGEVCEGNNGWIISRRSTCRRRGIGVDTR